MAIILANGKQQYFDLNGDPLVGGKLYTYEPGPAVTTPKDTYTDAGATSLNTNPIILNARGEATVFWSGGYNVTLKDSAGNLIWTVESINTGDDASVPYTPAVTGAVTTTAQRKLRERVSIFDFMTAVQVADVQAGTLLYDVGSLFSAACSVAYILTIADPYSNWKVGGYEVFLPPGIYRSDAAAISWIGGIDLVGSGRNTSVIRSSYNGNVFQLAPPTGVYQSTSALRDFAILGDRTKASQIGMALLRPTDMLVKNVYIQNCGGDGLLIKQGLTSVFENVVSYLNVGRGVRIMDGVNSWSDSTPTDLPTNACTFINLHSAFNDAANLRMDGTGSGSTVNGCTFIGGAFEYGYRSSAAGTGSNVEDYSTNYFPNTFNDVWFEGQVKQHILKTGTSIADTLRLTKCKHFSEGAGSYPERFVVATVGAVLADNCVGNGNLYRTVGGSNTPYRLTKATARIDLLNPQGSAITGAFVEDETNTTTGLYSNVRQDSFGAFYGPHNHRADSTDVGFEQYRTADAFAFGRFNANTRAFEMGSGATSPVTALVNNKIGVSADRGDTAQTLTPGVDFVTQRWATNLTANRVVTLSTTGAVAGHKFRVVRTGLGAFNLDVGGLKTIVGALAAWVEVEYDGAAWRLTGYGTL